jgi:hypothetical protein
MEVNFVEKKHHQELSSRIKQWCSFLQIENQTKTKEQKIKPYRNKR